MQANLGVMEKEAQAVVTHRRHLEQTRELLAEAGFASVDVHLLEHDPFNAYFVVRP